MRVVEFLSFVDGASPGLFEIGRYGWATRAWETKLPNGVTLGFVPETS